MKPVPLQSHQLLLEYLPPPDLAALMTNAAFLWSVHVLERLSQLHDTTEHKCATVKPLNKGHPGTSTFCP